MRRRDPDAEEGEEQEDPHRRLRRRLRAPAAHVSAVEPAQLDVARHVRRVDDETDGASNCLCDREAIAALPIDDL